MSALDLQKWAAVLGDFPFPSWRMCPFLPTYEVYLPVVESTIEIITVDFSG